MKKLGFGFVVVVILVVVFFFVVLKKIFVKSICCTRNKFLTQEKYTMKYITQHDLILLLEHSIDFPSHENLWHIHLYSDFLF